MDLKLVVLFSCVVAFVSLSKVEAASRYARDVEQTTKEGTTQTKELQNQLLQTLDSMKTRFDEFEPKLNPEEIIQGLKDFASKFEKYVKLTTDQFAATVSGTSTDTKTEQPAQPEQPQP